MNEWTMMMMMMTDDDDDDEGYSTRSYKNAEKKEKKKSKKKRNCNEPSITTHIELREISFVKAKRYWTNPSEKEKRRWWSFHISKKFSTSCIVWEGADIWQKNIMYVRHLLERGRRLRSFDNQRKTVLLFYFKKNNNKIKYKAWLA
jgi:hypothetical protein